MRYFSRLLTLALVLVAFGGSALAQAIDSTATGSGIPIESLLRPDGTLDRDRLTHGAIDLSGWRMVLGQKGEPRFVRGSGATLMDVAPGDEAWDDRFGPPGINGTVYALVVARGDLYVGGAFTIAGNALATNFARWDGANWSAVGDGASGPVYAMALDGDELYIGGQYLSAGGTSSRCVTQYNVRTGYYTGMGAGVYGGFIIRTNIPLARVQAIAVKGDSVFVAGSFTEAGQSIRSNSLACWNRATEEWSAVTGPWSGAIAVTAMTFVGDDLYAGVNGSGAGGFRRRTNGAWSAPLGGGVNDSVFAIVPSGGALYVGGQFTRAGELDIGRVARYDIAGDEWSAVGAGLDATVYALALDSTGLYAGGRFSGVGSLRINAVAQFVGGVWIPLSEGVVDSSGAFVRALALGDGGLFAGGRFRVAGRATAVNVAFWTGSLWRPVVRGGSRNVDRNGVDGAVYAIAVHGSDIYVGGDFMSAGGIPAGHVARWNGEEWNALGEGIGQADALVRALAIDSSGALYVGGIFDAAGGAPAHSIARWDGTRWSSLGGGVGGENPYVFALAVQRGALIVGGAFTEAGGRPAGRIARYDIATSTWSAIGSGVAADAGAYSYVTALGIDGDSVYVGGGFSSAGRARAFNIARVVGDTWTAVGAGVRPGANGPVAAIAVGADGVYIGGTFSAVGADTARNVALWNRDHWSAPGAGTTAPVAALALETDGSLIAGGEFTRAGSAHVGYIARFNGTTWSTLALGTNGPVQAVGICEEGIYAGGRFSLANGQKANNVALFDRVGWTSLGSDPTSGIIGTVLAAAIDSGEVYIGGLFASAGGVRASGIARWDGATWRPLGPGVDGPVRSIAIRGDEVYVGGEFTYAGGVERRGIARWSLTARRWSDVGGGLEGTGPYAFALAVRGDEVLVGGSFARAGGIEGTARVARWNAVRGEWSPLGGGISGSGYYTYVSAIALDSAGRIYVGGIFPYAGSTRVNNIAMYDGDWHPLGLGLNNAVYDIAIDRDDLYAAGEFLRAGDVAVRRVARWRGGAWEKIGGDGFDRRVYSLAVHRGMVYAAGEFLTVDDLEVYGITRWNGAAWETLGSGLTNPYQFSGAYALAVDDSSIYVGGNFTVAGRQPSYYFARWVPAMLGSGVASPTAVATGRTRMLRSIVPNPSTDRAEVRFDIGSAGRIVLELWTLDGRRIATLCDGWLEPGRHTRTLAADELPAGSYLLRIMGGGGVESSIVEVTR